MNIQTDKQIMVFRKDTQYGTNYSIGLSRKDKDGKYCNAYIPVKFKGDISLENQTKIYIRNGFLTFYLKQDGKPVFYIMIMEYETTDETIEKVKEESITSIKQDEVDTTKLFEEFSNEIAADSMDLPF